MRTIRCSMRVFGEATVSPDATQRRLPAGGAVVPIALLLTEQQLDALRLCARGISLRFESHDVVNPLLTAGFVEKNVAGVVRVTKSGYGHLIVTASPSADRRIRQRALSRSPQRLEAAQRRVSHGG